MPSNVEPLLEPGMALDRIAAWRDDIDALVTRTRAMSDRLSVLRVTTRDPRRLVEVTIDSQGALMDIRFGPDVARHDPDVLARTVMSTLRDARRQAAEQTRRIILDSIGPDSVAAREMLSRLPSVEGRP
ncbi:YbaB/EbfC family nucleoid-associated protein [Actinoplanes sp. HUAS TT8]|uniref:YbaB/EbfC family nucleoid-associated protein n=1 Tax=Actinoplanes sp. HUAS TT8 TaxID=3447453 RepID=UPI003F51DBB0